MEPIEHVSDTALWVAAYRAEESERTDALFRDPLAARLVGEKWREVSEKIEAARFTRWNVVIRTYVIDRFILQAIAQGIDTVLNLGAGMDTRPYRMKLPKSLRWIEIDFPRLIEFKEERLRGETPVCQLERVKQDLSDRAVRTRIFSEIASKSSRVLVLTEGVVPYLSNDQAASLAEDLHAQKNFRYWINEYIASHVVKYIQRGKIAKRMKNAPFQFHPEDWIVFFESRGWGMREIQYLGAVSEQLGRPVPLPRLAEILRRIMPSRTHDKMRKFSGYMLLESR